jgi:hypothetical protein
VGDPRQERVLMIARVWVASLWLAALILFLIR